MIEEQVKETEQQQTAPPNGKTTSSEKSLSIRVVDNSVEFEKLAEEWKQLAEVSDSYIFETFEWNRIWWKYFAGANQQLHIVCFYHEDQLVGIAPLFLDTFKAAGIPLYRSLRFIGSTVHQPDGEDLLGLLPYSDYLDFIIHPNYEEAVLERFLNYLGQEENFDEVILDEIPEKSAVWGHMISRLEKKGYPFSIKESSGCPIIKLDCSWDEHLSSLSKSSRYRTRRYVKKATKPDYKIFEVDQAKSIPEVHEAYDRMVQLHQKRWKELGFPGTFGEQRMYDFFKEISEVFFEKEWAEIKHISALEEGDKKIAIDLVFKYKDRTYLVHRALDTATSTLEESPGNVLLYMSVKETADEGKKEFDLLRGTESYKFRSANGVLTNHTITIKNPHKNESLSSKGVKRYVQLKRRARLEVKQGQIFLSRDGSLMNNVRDYGNFLKERISNKMASDDD